VIPLDQLRLRLTGRFPSADASRQTHTGYPSLSLKMLRRNLAGTSWSGRAPRYIAPKKERAIGSAACAQSSGAQVRDARIGSLRLMPHRLVEAADFAVMGVLPI
jgi:hypothetical protein